MFYRVVIPGASDTYLTGMTARAGRSNYNHVSQPISVTLPAGVYQATVQGQPNCTSMWASRLLISTLVLNR
ncbi:MAG: hypothetical protein ABI574_16720 [Burkholderiales bacterium]